MSTTSETVEEYEDNDEIHASHSTGPVSKGTKRRKTEMTKSRKSKKSRSETRGRWTEEEHDLFLEGFQAYGEMPGRWRKIAALVGTRTDTQVRTHAQKFFQRKDEASKSGEDGGGVKHRKGTGSNKGKRPEKQKKKKAPATPNSKFSRKDWQQQDEDPPHAVSPPTASTTPKHRLFSPLSGLTARSNKEGKQKPPLIPKNGVVIQGLHGDNKELNQSGIMEDLSLFLERKGARNVYKRMADTISEAAQRRATFSNWRNMEFVDMVDRFADEFADVKIRIAVCCRKVSGGNLRWLEFMDTDIVSNDYIPQHDISSPRGTSIKTIYCDIEFPYGVFVDEVKRWGRLKRVRGSSPSEVAELIKRRGLQKEYEALVEECSEYCYAYNGDWDYFRLSDIIETARPKFESLGVGLFLTIKDEVVRHGERGDYTKIFCWAEFVDRRLQPSYSPLALPSLDLTSLDSAATEASSDETLTLEIKGETGFLLNVNEKREHDWQVI